MFRLLIKELRVSPLRTFLTGFSMFVGIVSMVAAVLVGTLGRDALLSINAQIFGYTPICSVSISQMQMKDYEKAEVFLGKLEKFPGEQAIEASIKSEMQFASLNKLDDMKEKKKSLYQKLIFVDTVFTTSAYSNIYNMPLYEGRWLLDSRETAGLELVVNKAAAQIFTESFVVGSVKETMTLIPFYKAGIVNDGKDWPVIYVNIQPLLCHMPEIFSTDNLTVLWHDEEINLKKIQSCMNDMLYDTVKGNITNISAMDSDGRYDNVIDILQIGLSISALLLLFVSILGQINIGLASLEQRTHELLIRRALGATKMSISMQVLGAQFILSVLVCVVSLITAVLLVNAGGLLLPKDSPIAFPGFPLRAAFIAIIVSLLTALLGGAIPAVKALRLEPALVLR